MSKSALREGFGVHLCNSYTIALAKKNSKLKIILKNCDYNIADGWPISRLGRMQGQGASIRGADLFRSVCELTNGTEMSHFFLGGALNSSKVIQSNVLRRHTNLKICGVYSLWIENNDADLSTIFSLLQNARPNIVWIGMGTPKQDFIVETLRMHFNDMIFIPIGGVFDFLSGDVIEAPTTIQVLKIEWLYRLIQEPSRLWKRYILISFPYIASKLIKEVFFFRINRKRDAL